MRKKNFYNAKKKKIDLFIGKFSISIISIYDEVKFKVFWFNKKCIGEVKK